MERKNEKPVYFNSAFMLSAALLFTLSFVFENIYSSKVIAVMIINHVCFLQYHFLYSKMSPGWHLRTLQIDSRVSNLTPFAFPVFKIDKFTVVSPTFCESSLSVIFRFAIITSKFIIIAIGYTNASFSLLTSSAFVTNCLTAHKIIANRKYIVCGS